MFHGSMVALITPMDNEQNIDVQSLCKLVEFHIEAGTQAIIANGTTGEAATMDANEQKIVIKTVVDQVAGRIPVIAGTTANATRHAIKLTEAAMRVGADACLLMTPAYIKPTQEGLFQHYRAIAEAVPIPQILYNVPCRTVCDMLPNTVAQLSEISNIVGIKEATGSIERTKEIITLCQDRIDIFSSDDATALELMKNGAKGFISVTANVAPRPMRELADAALAGDFDCADTINALLNDLHHFLFVEANPIPLKWALKEMGLIEDNIRLPLTKLAPEHHSSVRDALTKARLI